MPTKIVSKFKKEKEVTQEGKEKVSGFKKLSLKKGKEITSSFKYGVATVSDPSNLKEGAKKSLELVNNNQEAIEKASSLAFSGGGLAAHAAFEGAKVVGKKLQ